MSVSPDYMAYGPTPNEVGNRVIERRPLKCFGAGHSAESISALEFHFSRPVTNDELQFLREVMQRAVACLPTNEVRP